MLLVLLSGVCEGARFAPRPQYIMHKIVKTKFVCDYCGKVFDSLPTIIKHEQYCADLTADIRRLSGYITSAVRHFENKGYTVIVRYLDNELLCNLKK